MIRVITLDDEPLALKLLSVYIERIPDMELVASFSDVEEAQKRLAEGDVDCLFTDISMPGISGIELVKNLSNPPLIVFTTAYRDYAVEGFRVNAVDYLVKPLRFEEFQEAVDKVRKQMELLAQKDENDEDERVLFFRVGHQKIRIVSSDILYVESMGAYLKVHTVSRPPFIVLGNFKNVIDADPKRLVRIHKSYAVNMERVMQSGKSKLTLTDDTTLPIGDAYSLLFAEKFSK